MDQTLFSFNRARISLLALARLDQRRVNLSADTMTNWVPRILGPMSLRPGFQYLLPSKSNNVARGLPFVFATDDVAILELSALVFRPLVDEAVITRPTVTAAVANGSFDSAITGWTDSDESGATSAWVTGGYGGFTGTGTNAAILEQQVTVNEVGTEHALRIVIQRGPVSLRVGSTAGDDDYISETALGTGIHSLAFTPSGDFHIRLFSRLDRQVLVDSCTLESNQDLEITTPWSEADLDNIRYDQSGDVVYIACLSYQQRKIERRGTRSWSLVLYEALDGPFRVENVGPITIAASALTGNVTLTASKSLFKSSNVGSLYQITSVGQEVTDTIGAENTFTDPIQITGISPERIFTIVISGTWTATVTLQRSLDSESGPWSDVDTWTANTTETLDDTLDNQIAWYRIGVATGDYTSGSVVATLSISSGSITGVAKITAFSSDTSVSAEVLDDLGGTGATSYWAEGKWSDRRGWPSAVALHEGRLWWAGKDNLIGSISDDYESFDPSFSGDGGYIDKNIGSGPVDTISWLLSLTRLMIGGQGRVFSARSSSLDEPITSTNINIKPVSSQGSYGVQAVEIDRRGVYVQKSAERIHELSNEETGYEYRDSDMTTLVPEMGSPGITRMAIQRQKDTRIHAIRSDGTVMLGVHDKAEDVQGWVDITTDGSIEDMVILPGTTEDAVYYLIKRTINGSTVRNWEKWALETECRGGTLNKQADSFVVFTNSPASAAVTGLDHLEGEDVVVWTDGVCLRTAAGAIATFTVTGGAISLTQDGVAYSASTGVVGLPYTATWESSKLGIQISAALRVLGLDKKINHLALLLAYTHAKGLEFGPDFDHLDEMPSMEEQTSVDPDTVHETYEQDPIPFPAKWESDLRLCLQASAPRPCTVMAAIPQFRENRK